MNRNLLMPALGLCLMLGFVTTANRSKAVLIKASPQPVNCIIPLPWIDELELEKRRLDWTRNALKQEREVNSNYKKLYFDLLQKNNEKVISKKSIKVTSPFKPYLTKLGKHWNYRFGLTESEMENYLAAILYNETGNAKRFIPKFAKDKYLETGDSGFGCHAWQIDSRYHSKCYPMTFAKSGNYAIKHVLYPCLKRAHKKGYKGINGLMAAATCYNSGQFNDNYSTNFYGHRALKHFNRLDK